MADGAPSEAGDSEASQESAALTHEALSAYDAAHDVRGGRSTHARWCPGPNPSPSPNPDPNPIPNLNPDPNPNPNPALRGSTLAALTALVLAARRNRRDAYNELVAEGVRDRVRVRVRMG